MHLVAKIIGRVLTLLAVVGFTLASVSTPLIPELAFLVGKFQDNIKLLIGAWGGCAVVDGARDCPPTAFGFSLSLVNFPGRTENGLPPIISHYTYAMILLPLTALLALVGVGLHTIGRTRKVQIAGASVALVAFLCGTGGLIFTFIIFMNALRRINEQFQDNPAKLGPAIWLVLVAYIFLFFATLILGGSVEPKETAGRLGGDKSNYYTMESQSEVFKTNTRNSGVKTDFNSSQDYYVAEQYFSEPGHDDSFSASGYPPALHSQAQHAYVPQTYPQSQHGFVQEQSGFYPDEAYSSGQQAQYYGEATTPPRKTYPQGGAPPSAEQYSPSDMYQSYGHKSFQQTSPDRYARQSDPYATGSPRSSRVPVPLAY